MTYLEAEEDTSSYASADEKSEDFYGGGGQFRRGGKEHFPQLWCSNGTYSSYGQASLYAFLKYCILPQHSSIMPTAACLVATMKNRYDPAVSLTGYWHTQEIVQVAQHSITNRIQHSTL